MNVLKVINRVKENLLWLWLIVVGSTIGMNACSQRQTSPTVEEVKTGQQANPAWGKMERTLNFLMANDLGRNGYYDQKPIAELMGEVATEIDLECVFAAGDVHHFEGVRSVNDPLWLTNYEWIYAHPELMIPWYPILGNHEYRGDTQSVLDYSKVSRRWEMPAHFYSRTFEKDDCSIRFVMVDTTPLIDKYRQEATTYPDAHLQPMDRQLAWVDSVLTDAKEDWVVVIGHHPIYAQTSKSDSERKDMQQRLDPILRKHRVDVYACGHIHNFQHLRADDSDIDYIVNSSASLSRKVKPVEETRYCSSEAGFSVIAVDKRVLNVHFMDKEGRVIYTVKRTK